MFLKATWNGIVALPIILLPAKCRYSCIPVWKVMLTLIYTLGIVMYCRKSLMRCQVKRDTGNEYSNTWSFSLINGKESIQYSIIGLYLFISISFCLILFITKDKEVLRNFVVDYNFILIFYASNKGVSATNICSHKRWPLSNGAVEHEILAFLKLFWGEKHELLYVALLCNGLCYKLAV